MIHVQNVSKVFSLESGDYAALQQIDLHIRKGEFIAVMGPSGSGKSTLLQLLGGLDVPTSGSVKVDGVTINELNEKQRTLFRRSRVGFVFQSYQLLPMMTAAENIALPLAANGASKSFIRSTVQQLLKDVHLEDKANHYPSQLSGGQQQRVAIARALAMNPALILADEPTGNLDRHNGADVLALLTRLNQEEQITVVMVTHDPQAAKAADRIVSLRDGRIVSEGGDRVELAAHGMA